MAKAQNKTQPTDMKPEDFIATVEHPTRRADAETLLELFKSTTGMAAKMWGPSMIGFGRYHYKYESGREGESFMTGFSPRKSNLVVYIMPGYRFADMPQHLSRLGKHKLGKACLYINKLADIELSVLEEMILEGVDYLRSTYETWDE